MITTTQLDKLALCASYCAYFINSHGKFEPDHNSPYWIEANFLGIPVAEFGGIDNKDAVLIGETRDYNIIAFRGTTATLCDWLGDSDLEPVTGKDLPGKVYAGMYNAFEVLLPQILPTLTHYAPNGKPFLVTGHSKGGPLAAYMAYILQTKHNIAPRVVTFASPHPGNLDFANAYHSAGIDHKRFENYQDAVPFMPIEARTAVAAGRDIQWLKRIIDLLPKGRFKADLEAFLKKLQTMVKYAADWQYEPVGELYFINKSFTIVQGVSYQQRIDYVEDVFPDNWYKPWDIPIIFDRAHIISKGYGYQKGVYPGL